MQSDEAKQNRTRTWILTIETVLTTISTISTQGPESLNSEDRREKQKLSLGLKFELTWATHVQTRRGEKKRNAGIERNRKKFLPKKIGINFFPPKPNSSKVNTRDPEKKRSRYFLVVLKHIPMVYR